MGLPRAKFLQNVTHSSYYFDECFCRCCCHFCSSVVVIVIAAVNIVNIIGTIVSNFNVIVDAVVVLRCHFHYHSCHYSFFSVIFATSVSAIVIVISVDVIVIAVFNIVFVSIIGRSVLMLLLVPLSML